MTQAESLRNLAKGHRNAGRTALADRMEKQAAALGPGGGGQLQRRGKNPAAAKGKGGKKSKPTSQTTLPLDEPSPAAPAAKGSTVAKGKGKKGKKAASKGAKKTARKKSGGAGKKRAGGAFRKAAAKRPATGAERSPAQKKAQRKAVAASKAKRKAEGKPAAAKSPAKRKSTKSAGSKGAKKTKAQKRRKSKKGEPGTFSVTSREPGKNKKSTKIAGKPTKAQMRALMTTTTTRYLDLKTGKTYTVKQVQSHKNPSGSWGSVGVTAFGVTTGILGAILLDRFIATMLTEDEKKEVEIDGAKSNGAQGRDAMRRIWLAPNGKRVLGVLAVAGVFAAGSAACGKRFALFGDFLIGNAAGMVGYTAAHAFIAYVLKMVPGFKVEDGNEVSWGGRLIPDYQTVPQDKLRAYVEDLEHHPPQPIDSTNDRMDVSERYDVYGLPWNVMVEEVIDVTPNNAANKGKEPVDQAVDKGKDAAEKLILQGLGDLGATRAANSAEASRVTSARLAANAAYADYKRQFGAPSAVGDKACCSACKAGKECEKDCDGKDHDHAKPTTDRPMGPIVNNSVPPVVKMTDTRPRPGTEIAPQPSATMQNPTFAPPRGVGLLPAHEPSMGSAWGNLDNSREDTAA